MDVEEQPNVIFIDDEKNVLSGLNRSLRPMRHKWNMSFVPSGADALKLAQMAPCHVLVTDLCMPQMSGVDVLKQFKRRHPDTIRIVLSGQTDRDAFWEAIGLAHVYMGKPCDSRILEAIISRAISAKTHLPNPNWRRIVSQTEFVPFFSDTWQALLNETKKKQPKMEVIAGIFQQDPGMSAKILQIANSAYFGTSRSFSTAQKAAVSLSTEGIHAMIAYYQSLLESESYTPPDDLLDSIRRRCRLTAMIAQKIAQEENPDQQHQAFLAGLLRALGEIVFLNHQPEKYRQAMSLAYEEKRLLWDTEREILECSHADLNLFLVCMWGLPEETCQALAPLGPPPNQPPATSVQTISYVAEILAQELFMYGNQTPKPLLGGDDLREEDIALYLPKWREIGRVIFEKLGSGNAE